MLHGVDGGRTVDERGSALDLLYVCNMRLYGGLVRQVESAKPLAGPDGRRLHGNRYFFTSV